MNDQTATMKDLTPDNLKGDNFSVSEAMSYLMDLGIVTDYADEYGEPGYSLDNEDGFFVIGDWWCHDRECDGPKREDGTRDLHEAMEHYPSLLASLEDAGMECAFYDEWIVDNEGSPSKAYRTTGDCYGWQSSILWTDGGFLTPDDGIEAWIEWCVENERGMGSSVWPEADIVAQGFVEYHCGYESGWHPGQNDDPEEVMKKVRADVGPNVEILFYLKDAGQFDIRYCVFVRPEGWEDGDPRWEASPSVEDEDDGE